MAKKIGGGKAFKGSATSRPKPVKAAQPTGADLLPIPPAKTKKPRVDPKKPRSLVTTREPDWVNALQEAVQSRPDMTLVRVRTIGDKRQFIFQ